MVGQVERRMIQRQQGISRQPDVSVHGERWTAHLERSITVHGEIAVNGA